jgi:serine/threonine protein kinase
VIAGVSSGTAAYASPEQAAGEEAQHASDVYSLGLVLLQCFTGTLAYPGSVMPSLLARLDNPPDIPAGIDPQWRDVLTAMTSRAPEDRPALRELIGQFTGPRQPGAGRHRLGRGASAAVTAEEGDGRH